MKPTSAHRFQRAAQLFAMTGLALALLTAHAQTFRLDDATSARSRVVPRFVVDGSGNPWGRSLEADHAVLRYGQVVYRLDMRPHVGQTARIYFVRAPEDGRSTGTRVNWTTADGQLGGSLLAGERALVWSGKLSQPWMEIALQLELDIDLQRWRPQPSNNAISTVTYFELDRLP